MDREEAENYKAGFFFVFIHFHMHHHRWSGLKLIFQILIDKAKGL